MTRPATEMLRSGSEAGPEIRAAFLAGLAEACAFAMPLHLIVTDAGGRSIPAAAFAVVFLPVFAVAVAAVCRFRDHRAVTGIVAGVAIAAGLALGRGGLGNDVLTVIAALLAALRITTLGLRDWRWPIGGSFVATTLALGVEAVVATGAQPGWTGPLVVLVPISILASLASRATTIWSEGDAGEVTPSIRRAWIGRAGRVGVALAAAMLAIAALGVRGGVFDRMASWLAPFGNAIASVFVWVASQIARPFLWIAERLRLDPEGVRRALARLQRDADEARRAAEQQTGGASTVGRLITLLLLIALIAGIVLLIRRAKPSPWARGRAARAPGEVVVTGLEPEEVPSGGGRFAPPGDRVRRWYAETLLALARAGVTKEPATTPAEFRRVVGERLPEIAGGFGQLTNAYEEVRYGAAVIDRDRLRGLQVTQREIASRVRVAIRTRRRSPDPGGPDPG